MLVQAEKNLSGLQEPYFNVSTHLLVASPDEYDIELHEVLCAVDVPLAPRAHTPQHLGPEPLATHVGTDLFERGLQVYDDVR